MPTHQAGFAGNTHQVPSQCCKLKIKISAANQKQIRMPSCNRCNIDITPDILVRHIQGNFICNECYSSTPDVQSCIFCNLTFDDNTSFHITETGWMCSTCYTNKDLPGIIYYKQTRCILTESEFIDNLKNLHLYNVLDIPNLFSGTIEALPSANLHTIREIILSHSENVDAFLTALAKNKTWVSLQKIDLKESPCKPSSLQLLYNNSSFTQPLIRTIWKSKSGVKIAPIKIEGYSGPIANFREPASPMIEIVYRCNSYLHGSIAHFYFVFDCKK